MKRTILCFAIALILVTALTAQTYKDGFYFAQDSAYANNQKNQVVLEVTGGKISSANWNLLSLGAGSQDLKTIAKAGQVAGAVTWAKNAATVEAFLVSGQNVNAASVAGVDANFNVKPFFDLVKTALAGNPVAKGAYKDGWYFALAASPDEYHTRNYALLTIVNGTIVDALWNGVLVGMPANINPSKIVTSKNNQYPMTGAKSRWDQQAEATTLLLLQTQSPDGIKVKPDGHADGVSGVSMQVKPFLDVVKEALAQAK